MSCPQHKIHGIIGKIVFALLTIAELMAIYGVFKAHVVAGGATFGGTISSYSLIAFALVTAVWMKAGHTMLCCGACDTK